MGDTIAVGTRVALKIGGSFGVRATHEVTGFQGGYLLICPIAKLGEVQPGQNWVPVTRITSDRVEVR